MEQEPKINRYLRQMLSLGGSDLHLSINFPAKARVHGNIQPLDDVILTPEVMEEIRALAAGFSYTGSPSASTSPESCFKMPARCFIAVVLPAPFGPTSPYTAPEGTVRHSPSSALCP